nr:MAG TPA: hypothetical protein [Caudoviricetes sp.]
MLCFCSHVLYIPCLIYYIYYIPKARKNKHRNSHAFIFNLGYNKASGRTGNPTPY